MDGWMDGEEWGVGLLWRGTMSWKIRRQIPAGYRLCVMRVCDADIHSFQYAYSFRSEEEEAYLELQKKRSHTKQPTNNGKPNTRYFIIIIII